jgi:hypothetical protein
VLVFDLWLEMIVVIVAVSPSTCCNLHCILATPFRIVHHHARMYTSHNLPPYDAHNSHSQSHSVQQTPMDDG